MSHRRQSFSCILSLPLLLSKGPCYARETDENRPQLSPALTAPRLRALQRAEDIGSALKGGVNVCQRQLVNEVLGPLVTQFVRNFGREDATTYQRGPNASLLGRVQAVKIIRHTTCRHLQSRPHRRRSPVARTRFKTLIYLKRFGAGAWGALASMSKSLAQMSESPDGDDAT